MIKIWQVGDRWYAQTHILRTAAMTAKDAIYEAALGSSMVEFVRGHAPVDDYESGMASLEGRMLAVLDCMTDDKNAVELTLLNAELEGLQLEWNKRWPQWEPNLTCVLALPARARELIA